MLTGEQDVNGKEVKVGDVVSAAGLMGLWDVKYGKWSPNKENYPIPFMDNKEFDQVMETLFPTLGFYLSNEDGVNPYPNSHSLVSNRVGALTIIDKDQV